MADNVTLDPGSGGATLATDDIAGTQHQRVKIQYGTDGSATDVSDTNPLPIDDAGGSITIDGTVTANLSATDNAVLDQIEVNTSYGDSVGGGTEAAALRVTIANNSTGVLTVDNAGTFATQVDGDALTALQLIDDAVHADDAGFTLGTSKGVVVMGFAGTQSVDANDAAALACDTDGALHISDGGNSITIDGTITADAGTNLNTSALALEAGNIATVAGAVSGSEMQVDVVAALPAGDNNIGNVDVASALPAGDNNIGNVDIASAIPAGTNNIGDVDVATIAAGSTLIGDVGLSGARTSGGTTLYKNIDVDESEDAVKASAGQVYWIHAINLSAAVKYLKLYNATVATVVVGTTTPDLTFPIPTQGDTNGAGFTLSIPNGIAFGTAITIAATTGVADNDSGAPGANEVVVNLGYA